MEYGQRDDLHLLRARPQALVLARLTSIKTVYKPLWPAFARNALCKYKGV